MRSSRHILLAGTSLLGVVAGIASTHNAKADAVISGTSSAVNWSTGNLSITNSGTITGVSGNTTAAVTVGPSAAVGTLSNNGVINGAISTGSTAYGAGVANGGGIHALTNNGTISGCTVCAAVSNGGTIGSLANNGMITGSGNTGVLNTGTIGTLSNAGTITGGTIGSSVMGIGLYNGSISAGTNGSIGQVNNSGVINGVNGVLNAGNIGTLSNSGLISGTDTAIVNNTTGSIGSLSNANGGTISGSVNALVNKGRIGSLSNNGLITGSGALNVGIGNAGTIGSIDNLSGGTISGANFAIANSGIISSTIGGTVSTSGTNGLIGMIANSGVIAGNIDNQSTNGLVISGGSGSTFGTLTGYGAGSRGTITSPNASLTFAAGNILLNDDINVGTNTVSNTGATLALTNANSITGNYLQTGGALAITASSATSYGALSVSGNALINRTTITITGSGLAAGEALTIVQAGSGSYTNDVVSVRGVSGLSASLSTVGSNLVVALTQGGYSAIGASAGGMGASLDVINALTSPAAIAFQNTVLAALDALPASNRPAAIRELAPTQINPAMQVAALAVTPTSTAIEQHALAMDENGAAGASAGSAPHAWGLWGQMLGGMALRNSTAEAVGYQSSTVGLVSGLDFHADPDTTVGAAFSWNRGWSWGMATSSGSFVTVDSYQLTGYGSHYWHQAFIEGQAGVGYDNFRQRRTIGYLNAAGQPGNAYANYDGQHYQGRVGGGYDIPADDGITATPMIGLSFLRAVTAGYTETGSEENLLVRRHGVQSLTHDLGGKVSWSVGTDWGILKPELRLAWVHDYVQGAINTTGVYSGLPTPYAASTARLSPDGARVDVGATLEKSDSLTLQMQYEAEARHDYQSHTGMLKATWAF